MDDKMRKEVLGEVLMDELKVIREYVQGIPAIKKDVAFIKEDVEVLKTDVKAIKAVVKDYSKQLGQHDVAIRELQQKTA